MASGTAPPLRLSPRDQIAGWITAALLIALALVPLTAAWAQAPDLGHGWTVPLLLGYLWWERWDERPGGIVRPQSQARGWLLLGLLAALALPLRLLLTPFPLWPMGVAAYVGVLVAAALTMAWLGAGSAGVKWVGGPLIIVAGALPWPTLLETSIVGPMREWLAAAAAEVCYLAGVSALAAGTTLRLAHTWVGVDETCGGMRSLQASVMAALFLGEWLRLRWLRRGALIAAAVGAAVFGNLLRILLLVWRANAGGEEALKAAHDAAGWLALAATLGLTGWVARRMRDPAVSGAPAPRPASSPRVRAGLPRAALRWSTTLVAVLGLIEVGTRAWYWRGELREAASVAHWGVNFPDGGADFRAVPLADGAREMLRPDLFAAGEWRDAQQRPVSAYYVEWQRGQAAYSIPFLHNPTVCLPMSGCDLVRPIGTIPVRWAGGELPFRAYLFRRNTEEFAVGFVIWDTSRGRMLESHESGWRAWFRAQLTQVADARADQPAQLLTVATWGEKPVERLAGTIESLIVKR